MGTAEEFIKSRLAQRVENGSKRNLSINMPPVDFCSNDYLGFARSEELKQQIEKTLQDFPSHQNGSGGSRLLSGNHAFTEETERFIAKFHHAEGGLIFNSGYDANVGLLSSIPQRGDTIISDELIHASLIDGARLSHANRHTFGHNDINQLEAKLQRSKGNIYVIVESVYSMDGDLAPLTEIALICKAYHANLIVDEAHALGIFGKHGVGLVQSLGLEHQVFARIMTFGKALGCHGAIVLGSDILRQYLINFARSFIYTTAAPLHNIAAVKCAYQRLLETDYTPLIAEKIKLYHNQLSKSNLSAQKDSGSTIQTILFDNNSEAKLAAQKLQNKGYDVRAILSPTVPEGKERIRICLHLFNSDQQIVDLAKEIEKLQ
ncbi:aminotransferase class I/II-fold pyridoxal phosphate-dependent enzyme [Pedobacter sp. PWIIR3]